LAWQRSSLWLVRGLHAELAADVVTVVAIVRLTTANQQAARAALAVCQEVMVGREVVTPMVKQVLGAVVYSKVVGSFRCCRCSSQQGRIRRGCHVENLRHMHLMVGIGIIEGHE
jgi:hypothetical protein